MINIGPAEQAVIETLQGRPARIIREARRHIDYCFAGLFNGALSKGYVNTNGLFIGKAECEWGWSSDWEELKRLGLIEYRLEETRKDTCWDLIWSITEKGWEVRNDDIAYFSERVNAWRVDNPKEE